jgi:phenylpropionate dioxygenase-like ring-hydroxylating dioxygenase large terminal subunit
MLSREDNDLLTLTGAHTPAGQYFRRFWLPVALSRELPEPDCPPIRIKIMGEELIAFRDTSGQVGVIEPRCPHRGANLFYGRNEEHGIRCVYHGWKFDVNGRCLEIPNAPAESKMCERISILAYPAREYGEMIWAYLGPSNELPELPELEVGLVAQENRFVIKKLQQCNWAQTIEGALDTAHFSFLHMPAPKISANVNKDAPLDEGRLRWVREDPMPRFTITEHDVGFVVGAARQADGSELYWRTTQYMLPSHSTTPSALPGETYFGYTWVPIDDVSCWIYTYAWNPERPIDAAERSKLAAGHGTVSVVDDLFIPIRKRENDYLIDRMEQAHLTYTGIRGVAEQDAMIQDSQGLIADRTRENLTATDAAVVRFRRTFLGGVKALAEGTAPAAANNGSAYRLRSGSWIADRRFDFDAVMTQRFGDPIGRIDKASS